MLSFFQRKKVGLLKIFCGATLMFFYSCEKAYVDFGSGFVDNSATQLVYVDTSSVEVSSLYVDTFSTTANGALLCGDVTDPAFGKITTTSYFSVGLPSSSTIPSGSVFDSLELILPLNGYSYGDTLSSWHINVHQLNQVLNFPSGQTAFYNNSTVPYNSTPLGSKDIVVRPNISDTVGVRLSQSLGADLYDKIVNHSSQLSTVELFDEYFKGLAITGNGNNNLILGFKDSIRLRLYYDQPGVFTEKAFIDFSLYRNSKQFYNVSINRTGTALDGLGPANRIISSNSTGHQAYGQSLTGSMIKVRFPYLRSLLQLPGFVKIMSAQLVIRPAQGSFSSIFPLAPKANMASIIQNNTIDTYLTTVTSSTSTEIQTGNLTIDQVYGITTAYTYDVTDYLLAQIELGEITSNGLVLLPQNEASTFDRFVIGDRLNSTNKIELKVYYAKFN